MNSYDDALDVLALLHNQELNVQYYKDQPQAPQKANSNSTSSVRARQALVWYECYNNIIGVFTNIDTNFLCIRPKFCIK